MICDESKLGQCENTAPRHRPDAVAIGKRPTVPTRADKSQELPGAGKLMLRVVGAILLVVGVGVVATLLMMAVGDVSGALRYVVGAVMGLSIAWFLIGYFRYMGRPPPPDLEPLQVDPELQLAYVCEMCGLELAVVAVAKERAPKHCGEAMVLVRNLK